MKLARAFSIWVFCLLALSAATAASAQTVPNPAIRFAGAESYVVNGQTFTRYIYEITNRGSFPAHLFQASPGLPPCGNNANSSRTWIDLFRQDGTRLYGFCAINDPANLNRIWFALTEGTAPPANIYIELKDRLTNRVYRSNLAPAPRGSGQIAAAAAARRALASGATPTLQLIVAACDSGDQPGPGSTPPSLPGAATVSAREAKCIVDTLGNRLVVLAAVHDPRRLPGARDVDWANAGGPQDSNQAAFTAMLSGITNGNGQRPLLIYCHHESCGLSSVVVVRRAVAAGYSMVFWMRPGLDGWSRAGFAFETAR